MTRRVRLHAAAAAAAALLLFATGCTAGDAPPSPSASSTAAPTDVSVCGYLYEWVDTFRFPLQPDPHAAYTYVIPKITDEAVGFEITGAFPYAAWTEWMVYTGLGDQAQPYSVVKDSDIAPDSDSVNPFVPGTPVLSPDREFRLLVVPDGTDLSAAGESLQDVPASNVLSSPPTGHSFVLANRVYNAFPGYNQGGAAGPTDTPFPKVRAVDLDTGEGVDCSSLNLIPDAKSPTDMPDDDRASARAVTLDGGDSFGAGPGAGSSGTGAEYAPALDPALIEFTRPPLLPGADVSSVPPADSCAGYLGARRARPRSGSSASPTSRPGSTRPTSTTTPSSCSRRRPTSRSPSTAHQQGRMNRVSRPPPVSATRSSSSTPMARPRSWCGREPSPTRSSSRCSISPISRGGHCSAEASRAT